jgi:hypothetical protein
MKIQPTKRSPTKLSFNSRRFSMKVESLPIIPLINSRIISSFPDILSEFCGKKFQLLWGGSHDGFGSVVFHNRCDGHANSLTLIQDGKKNIFGGFTPIAWESKKWTGRFADEDNRFKSDANLESFLFTLKNPHHLSPRRFGLNPERKHMAIWCGGE